MRFVTKGNAAASTAAANADSEVDINLQYHARAREGSHDGEKRVSSLHFTYVLHHASAEGRRILTGYGTKATTNGQTAKASTKHGANAVRPFTAKYLQPPLAQGTQRIPTRFAQQKHNPLPAMSPSAEPA